MAKTATIEQPAAADKPKPQKAAKPKTPNKPAKSTAVAVAKPQQQVARADNREPSLLAIIMQAVKDPACDVSKMRELLNMKKEIDTDEAKKSFTRAFVELQNELPEIQRTGEIIVPPKDGKKGYRTPFATFEVIHKAIKPLLRAHGFTLSFATEPSETGSHILVRGTLRHIGGHSQETVFPAPIDSSGGKNNIQGWGSSMSYGKRYCTIALLNIVSKAPDDADKDGEAETQEIKTISPAQLKEINAAIDFSGIKPERIFEKYGIEELAALPAAQHKNVINAIKQFKEEKDRRGQSSNEKNTDQDRAGSPEG